MEVAMHRQPPTTKLCKLTFTNLGHNHNSQDVEEEHPQWSLGAPGSGKCVWKSFLICCLCDVIDMWKLWHCTNDSSGHWKHIALKLIVAHWFGEGIGLVIRKKTIYNNKNKHFFFPSERHQQASATLFKFNGLKLSRTRKSQNTLPVEKKTLLKKQSKAKQILL